MPVCSVIECGIRKTPNQPSVTIHKIPRNECRKKMWLEAIGIENINPNIKDIFICSLHFDHNCFNKALDVTRLRDDAVPFKFQHASQHKTDILKENQLETIPVLAGPDTSTLVPLKVANTSTHTVPHTVAGTSGIATFIVRFTAEACWLKQLISDFFIDVEYVFIYEDNQSSIKVAKNPVLHNRMKHIDIKHHFIHEKIMEGIIKLSYRETSQQVAVLLIKPLSGHTFVNLRELLEFF